MCYNERVQTKLRDIIQTFTINTNAAQHVQTHVTWGHSDHSDVTTETNKEKRKQRSFIQQHQRVDGCQGSKLIYWKHTHILTHIGIWVSAKGHERLPPKLLSDIKSVMVM